MSRPTRRVSTIRRTSVYTLRVALSAGESTESLLSALRPAVSFHRPLSDVHSDTKAHTPYVAVSWRCEGDAVAVSIAEDVLDAIPGTFTHESFPEWVLSTGMAAHARIVESKP